MKKIVIAIFILTFISCKKNSSTFKINGNVETINYICKEASEKFGKIIDGKTINDSLIKLKFNQKGQLIDSLWSEKEYLQIDNLWNKNVYLKKKEYKEDLVIKETYFKNNTITNLKTYSYNNDGKINEINIYDKDKKILNKRVYKYFEKKCTVKIYNKDGILIDIEKITYDDSNNLIEILNSNGKTTFKYVDGILSEKKHIKKESIKIEDQLNSSEHTDKLTYTQISNYNKDGQISTYHETMDRLTISAFDGSSFPNGSSSYKITYSYSQYDEMQNWTKQVIRNDNGIDCIVERKISYRK